MTNLSSRNLIDYVVDSMKLSDLQNLAYDIALSGKLTLVKVFLDKIASDADDNTTKETVDYLVYASGVFGQKELITYVLSRANAYDLDNHKFWAEESDTGTLELLNSMLIANNFGPVYHILTTNRKVADMVLENYLYVCLVLEPLIERPGAFRSGSEHGILERLLNWCIPVNIQDNASYDRWSSTKGIVHVKKVQPSRWNFIQTLVQKVNNIRDKKLMHIHAHALLKLLCRQIDKFEYITDHHGKSLKKAAVNAAKWGNYAVLVGLLKVYPATIIKDEQLDIFKFAITLRHEKIFSFVYHSNAVKNLMIATSGDDRRRNLLHRVAKLPAPNLLPGTGALLQMQREMQWFQIADSLILQTHRDAKVKVKGVKVTPRELFTNEHKELKERGEKMVESTAQSGTIVAALIATVAFAAALTVPAGVNQDTGVPLFLGMPAFMLFAISIAMGFFSSITSVMAFTVVLTSPTSEDDFAFSLPLKLIMGLVSMSFSAACIIVAFCATLYIVLSHQMKLIFIPVSILAVFPIAFFVFMQLPFLVELVKTTFGNAHLPSPDKALDLLPQHPSPPTLGLVLKLKQMFHRAAAILKFPFLKKSRQANNNADETKPSIV